MRVLITGTSSGIGKAIALLFIEKGNFVIGLDKCESSITSPLYTHYLCDISIPDTLPDVDDIDIFIANAGVQDSEDDILINLKGTINTSEKYSFKKGIKSVLFIASASAHTGAEFPLYCASKGGLLSYMKNVARRLAITGATCNSLSPGGVTTELNKPVMEDEALWGKIMELTPLKKWASAEEIAQWAYFVTAVNKSMTGEDILIDNGETKLNGSFIWPE